MKVLFLAAAVALCATPTLAFTTTQAEVLEPNLVENSFKHNVSAIEIQGVSGRGETEIVFFTTENSWLSASCYRMHDNSWICNSPKPNRDGIIMSTTSFWILN